MGRDGRQGVSALPGWPDGSSRQPLAHASHAALNRTRPAIGILPDRQPDPAVMLRLRLRLAGGRKRPLMVRDRSGLSSRSWSRSSSEAFWKQTGRHQRSIARCPTAVDSGRSTPGTDPNGPSTGKRGRRWSRVEREASDRAADPLRRPEFVRRGRRLKIDAGDGARALTVAGGHSRFTPITRVTRGIQQSVDERRVSEVGGARTQAGAEDLLAQARVEEPIGPEGFDLDQPKPRRVVGRNRRRRSGFFLLVPRCARLPQPPTYVPHFG